MNICTYWWNTQTMVTYIVLWKTGESREDLLKSLKYGVSLMKYYWLLITFIKGTLCIETSRVSMCSSMIILLRLAIWELVKSFKMGSNSRELGLAPHSTCPLNWLNRCLMTRRLIYGLLDVVYTNSLTLSSHFKEIISLHSVIIL